jgi:hypothetical protein
MGQEQEREQREQQRVRNYYSYLVIVKTRKSLIPLLVSLFVFLSFSGTHRSFRVVAWLFLFFLYLVLSQREKKSCFFAQKFLKFL